MALESAGSCRVRNTNLPPSAKRALWHRVVSFTAVWRSGKVRTANTACGRVYDFPTANTVFSKNIGADTFRCPECEQHGNV